MIKINNMLKVSLKKLKIDKSNTNLQTMNTKCYKKVSMVLRLWGKRKVKNMVFKNQNPRLVV